MPKEIERKFLVNDSWRPVGEGEHIAQGYLAHGEEATVRVRLKGQHGYLTVKGKTTGISRSEFEYEIPLTDAKAMLKLCAGSIVTKRRYVDNFAGNRWEIDVFEDENAPLIMAEIELQDEAQTFAKPPWLGDEVSFDRRYFNSSLANEPYSHW